MSQFDLQPKPAEMPALPSVTSHADEQARLFLTSLFLEVELQYSTVLSTGHAFMFRGLVMNQLNQDAFHVVPIYWRHGYILRDEMVSPDGDRHPCYVMDYRLERLPRNKTGDAILEKLLNKEARFLSTQSFPAQLPFSTFQATIDTLPTEFIAHQIMDIDTTDESRLYKFVCDWGFPYSPLRNDDSCADNMADELVEKNRRGIILTERMISEQSSAISLISMKEAQATIQLLQETWRRLEAELTRAEEESDLGPINAAATTAYVGYGTLYSPTVFRTCEPKSCSKATLGHRGLLTSAIANQLLSTIRDPAEWKLCASCGRAFKRKQGASLSPDTKSKYCCETCRERDKKRRYRKAASDTR